MKLRQAEVERQDHIEPFGGADPFKVHQPERRGYHRAGNDT